jgi:hypothetical protein
MRMPAHTACLLAAAIPNLRRHTQTNTCLQVSSTAGLEVGEIYILRWKDQDSLFVQYL